MYRIIVKYIIFIFFYIFFMQVCMKPDQTLAEGQAIAEDLMTKLGISNSNLVTCAYVDLLNKKTET